MPVSDLVFTVILSASPLPQGHLETDALRGAVITQLGADAIAQPNGAVFILAQDPPKKDDSRRIRPYAATAVDKTSPTYTRHKSGSGIETGAGMHKGRRHPHKQDGHHKRHHGRRGPTPYAPKKEGSRLNF
jgi:hypothetical protein